MATTASRLSGDAVDRSGCEPVAEPGALALQVAREQRKRARSLMPPPAPREQQQAAPTGSAHVAVLTDDDFDAKMAAIIERDYFPDIKPLQNKLEWTAASESGDPDAISNAQRNIMLRRAGYSIPLDARPPGAGGGAATPTPSNLSGASVRSSRSAAAPSTARGGAAQLPEGAVMPPHASVDDFAAVHTTEDQQSVEDILAANDARRRDRHVWMYRESARTDAQTRPARERLAGPVATDGYGTSGQAPDTLIGWRHTPHSALYFAPAAGTRELSAAERALMPIGAAPATLARNTRFRGAADAADGGTATPSTLIDTDAVSPGAGSSAAAAARSDGDATPAGGEAQIGGGRGYRRIPTPSPSPAMLGGGVMTWGELDGTPVVIDQDGGGGGGGDVELGLPEKAFVGAKLTRGEEALRRATRAAASGRPRKRPRELLQRRGVDLSPAARSLLQSAHRAKGLSAVDTQLRASYGHRTPGRGGGGTPAASPAPSSRAPTPGVGGLLGEMTPEWRSGSAA